ncbi:hypothetical protein N8703_03345 [Verrucomicrobia bacterium]|nr:hypothetical protein [Verrucomicrobiota bacterium]
MKKIRIVDARTNAVTLNTRMPFKYGIATMTTFPLVFVMLHCEIDGKPVSGIASDLLPPKWFKKDPDQDPQSELQELQQVIDHACQAATGMESSSIFDAWLDLYRVQSSWGQSKSYPALLTHFGTSLVERALIDTYCRHTSTSFFKALKANAFSLQLETIHAHLHDSIPGDYLPQKPLERILARHTIGLGDPLSNEDIPKANALNDGLPHSLEDCIKTYGLKHFKIKISGNYEADLQRLRAIASIVNTNAINRFGFSLDGNEQFTDLPTFKDYWLRMTRSEGLKTFFERLLFVEQPLHRDVALLPEIGEHFETWQDRPPIIIDESDGDLHSMAEGLKLGYAGTSHKNCKGVFKSIANKALLQKHQEENPNRTLLMSGEDLCNQGPIAVMQDLCVAGALGIASVERNGHHYCRGLSDHPAAIQDEMLRHHGDVYAASAHGWPSLKIEDGSISLRSINKAPFGVGFMPQVEAYPC